jgi:hypothetical protein
LSCPSKECCGVRDHKFSSKNPDILFKLELFETEHTFNGYWPYIDWNNDRVTG